MSFAEDVLAGLSRPQKRISPKYLYDAEGARLYSEICELEEYYPVRVERSLIAMAREEIRARVQAGCGVLELGPGGPEKAIPILKALVSPTAYFALEISREALQRTLGEIHSRFPQVHVSGEIGDFTAALEKANPVAGLGEGRKLVLFLGSTLGNLDLSEAVSALRAITAVLRPEDLLLLGADLLKPAQRIERAYNDSQGITARFNRNLLERMNRELGAEFRPGSFEHVATFNSSMHRLEMHLRSLYPQSVRIEACGRSFAFAEGETIHTESSYKHDLEELQRIFSEGGLRIERSWTDPQWNYGLFGLTPKGAHA